MYLILLATTFVRDLAMLLANVSKTSFVSVHNTTLQAKTVTISTSKTITICYLYLPPSDNPIIVLLTRLIDQLQTQFVVFGDFNGNSITWGCDKNNS